MITHSSNTNIADWSLDFDERVSFVVWVGWTGLAIGAEICVMADSTLVAIASNVCCNTTSNSTERAIAVDTMMSDLAVRNALVCGNIRERLIDGDESMARVDEAGVYDTSGAVIPVGTVEALVTNTIDVLVTTITDSIMACITSGFEKSACKCIEWGVFDGGDKRMLRVMAMLKCNMTWDAKIEILTSCAGDKIFLWEFCQ